jgi:hypothetical protein
VDPLDEQHAEEEQTAVKKILILIVVLAAIWAIPGARNRFVAFMQPVAGKLGPVGEKRAGPMRRYTARTQLSSILQDLTATHDAGRTMPDARTFKSWLRAHPPSEQNELDPWGQPYYLRQHEGVYTIGSAGPDTIKGNADDIVKSETF